MELSDSQLERYARHIVLKEIGGSGQRRIMQAHVAVVGAGGIGSPVVQYLAAAGVGRITLIDDDVVSLSNLQRQILFATRDVGRQKVAAVANMVQRLNTDVTLLPVDRRIDAHNAERLLAGAQVVVDGSDNVSTRLAVADAAMSARVPLISASVGQFDGQLAVYRGWENDKPCYRCLARDTIDRTDVSCADQGVLGALTGIIGSMAAIEAIRQIIPFGEDPAGKLLLMDALAFRFRTVVLSKSSACACTTKNDVIATP